VFTVRTGTLLYSQGLGRTSRSTWLRKQGTWPYKLVMQGPHYAPCPVPLLLPPHVAAVRASQRAAREAGGPSPALTPECSVLSAQCSVLSAQCSVLSAQCSAPSPFRPLASFSPPLQRGPPSLGTQGGSPLPLPPPPSAQWMRSSGGRARGPSCASPVGSLAVYFPQGHVEQVRACGLCSP